MGTVGASALRCDTKPPMTAVVSRAFRVLSCLLAAALLAAPATTVADPAVPLSDPDSYLAALQLIEQQHAVGEAQREFLAAPAQRAERQASQTENADETAHEAAGTLAEEFGGALESLDWTGTRLAQDGSYDKFLSDYVARVTIDGRRQLVESTVPLRAPDDSGKLAPVDLSLDATSSGFAPANPITELTLPTDLGDGIRVGEGAAALRITPADAAGASHAVKVDDNAALYANTSTDTDFVAAPITTGAETFLQLRSPDAPEVSRLKIDATGSLALAKLATGQVEARVDGTLVARVAPPWAKDAQGKQIPVEMTVDGSDLVLTVRHHNADVAYPILVDPTIDGHPADDWFNGGASGGSWFRGNRAGLEQWNYSENPSGWYPHGTYCVANTDCALGAGGYNGLYSYSYAGAPYTTASNHFSEWYYRPYDMANRTTYISRAEYAYVWNLWHGTANFYLWFGIQGAAPTSSPAVSTAAAGVPQVSNGYVVLNGGSGGTTTNTSLGKVAVFAALPTPNTTHPGAGTYYVGGAVIFLDDTDTPGATVTHTSAPTDAWVKDFDDTATIAGHDGGLGIRAFSVGVDNNFSATSYQPMVGDANTTCDGSNTRPCYTDRSYPYHYTAADLGDGAHTLQGCTWDALWKTSCTTWHVNIDRTGPAISPSGSLWEKRSQGVLNSGALQVDVSDGLSGIATATLVETRPDGTTSTSSLTPCAGGKWCATASSNDIGVNHFRIEAVDNIGNASAPVAWDVLVVDTVHPGATYGGADQVIDTDSEYATVGYLLATIDSPEQLWGSLTTDEKNSLMEGGDPWAQNWLARIDTVSPFAPADINADDEDAATRVAYISWETGDDPDLEPSAVPGSQVASSEYRWQRDPYDWSAWHTTDEDGFSLQSADPGDVVTIQVKSRDAAGNASSMTSDVVTIPADHSYETRFAGPLTYYEVAGCIQYCPIVLAGAAAGATAAGAWVLDHVSWDAFKWTRSDARNVEPPTDETQAQADYDAAAKRNRARGRDALKDAQAIKPREEAHHIIAVGSPKSAYAREVARRCGLDLNKLPNMVGVDRRYHRRMHTNSYYRSINRVMRRYDPRRGIDPCQVGPESNLARALEAIAEYIKQGRWAG